MNAMIFTHAIHRRQQIFVEIIEKALCMKTDLKVDATFLFFLTINTSKNIVLFTLVNKLRLKTSNGTRDH